MTNGANTNVEQWSDLSRDGLRELVDDYLWALVENDPGGVPLAPDVAFVENIEKTSPGEGLWESASALPTDFKIYVPDPVAGQVGFLGRIEEDGAPVLLGLRLAVADESITEIEHVVARDLTPGREGHSNLLNLEVPRSSFRQSVPAEHRNTREQLLDIAEAYYDAVSEDDASVAPFAKNCVRAENGYQTTCKTPPPEPTPDEIVWTLDCDEQLDSGAMSYITDIEPVRVDIADTDTGLVCGFSQLRHPMEETTYELEGVSELDRIVWDLDPFDTVAFHILKISGGKIRAIEATGFRAPYDAPTGWE